MAIPARLPQCERARVWRSCVRVPGRRGAASEGAGAHGELRPAALAVLLRAAGICMGTALTQLLPYLQAHPSRGEDRRRGVLIQLDEDSAPPYGDALLEQLAFVAGSAIPPAIFQRLGKLAQLPESGAAAALCSLLQRVLAGEGDLSPPDELVRLCGSLIIQLREEHSALALEAGAQPQPQEVPQRPNTRKRPAAAAEDAPWVRLSWKSRASSMCGISLRPGSFWRDA